MALGLPVIASTGGTAADDFIDERNAYPVSTHLATCDHAPCAGESPSQLCVFPPCVPQYGCSCEDLVRPPTHAEPSLASVSSQMWTVAEQMLGVKGKPQSVRAKARLAQVHAKMSYCWDQLLELYVRHVESLGGSRMRRRSSEPNMLVWRTNGDAHNDLTILRSGESLRNGLSTATLQNDGNFVVEMRSRVTNAKSVVYATWTSESMGTSCPCTLRVGRCAAVFKDFAGIQFHVIEAPRCPPSFGPVTALALTDDGAIELRQGWSTTLEMSVMVRLEDGERQKLARKKKGKDD